MGIGSILLILEIKELTAGKESLTSDATKGAQLRGGKVRTKSCSSHTKLTALSTALWGTESGYRFSRLLLLMGSGKITHEPHNPSQGTLCKKHASGLSATFWEVF